MEPPRKIFTSFKWFKTHLFELYTTFHPDRQLNICWTLHWLPISKRITFKVALLAFKCKHSLAPSYLNDLILNYIPLYPLDNCGPLIRILCFNLGPRLWLLAGLSVPLHLEFGTVCHQISVTHTVRMFLNLNWKHFLFSNDVKLYLSIYLSMYLIYLVNPGKFFTSGNIASVFPWIDNRPMVYFIRDLENGSITNGN